MDWTLKNAKSRLAAQETTIRKLHDKITEQQVWIDQLQNRCKALSMGSICAYCGHSKECKNFTTVETAE